jgi:hypothetical protein
MREAVKNLLQLHSAVDLRLVLETDKWLAVTDGIRRGLCNVRKLNLAMLQAARCKATEAAKAIARAIRLDSNLDHLLLRMENGFTDEPGVALAEALTVNKTVRMISLSAIVQSNRNVSNAAKLGAQSYETFGAMLRVNASMNLVLPPLDMANSDEKLLVSYGQMRIPQRLNRVDRVKVLLSSQTTKTDWHRAQYWS